MKEKSPIENLKDEISLLKSKRAYEYEFMKAQFLSTKEELKPKNLIASTLKKVVNMPGTRNTVINGAFGLITGFITKRFFFGGATSPVKKVIGNLLSLGVSSVVYKKTNMLKAIGGSILSSLLPKRKAATSSIPKAGISH